MIDIALLLFINGTQIFHVNDDFFAQTENRFDILFINPSNGLVHPVCHWKELVWTIGMV